MSIENFIPTLPIHSFLENYAKSGTLRCHMPGHKGENPIDITEIDGADSLFEASGIIAESENNASRLFGTNRTLYSCGGSTLAIQTMLALALSYGKTRIAAGRYSHKSLISAAVLLGFNVDWIYPESFLSAQLSAESIDAAITEKTAAVFVNAIDYYGGECDISSAAEICRKKGVPLLVDNAHGAYRVFTDRHPIALGADMSADSAHKTLPALTGTAYLHIGNEKFVNRAMETMALFGSSSPSYLLLDSLDLCNRHIACEAERAKGAILAVEKLKVRLAAIGYTLHESDEMRVTINARKYGYSGSALADELRTEHIECEMSDENYVVLLFSTVTDENITNETAKRMSRIIKKTPIPMKNIPVLRCKFALSPKKAYFSAKEKTALSDAVGRICAEIKAPCPPCIPLVMPGEIISEEAAGIMTHFGIKEISVTKE